MKRNSIPKLHFHILGILAACFSIINVLGSDPDCLRSIKESLEDRRHELSSWNFSIHTKGFVCSFKGVTCWNDQEDKVLGVSLRGAGLKGPFPTGIRYCTSIQHLDLSRNQLSGSIPSDLAQHFPYIVSLDLSNNNLSGPIPPSIANFSYINVLRLDNNHLTGEIPSELSKLERLHEFSVTNNRLSGPIPIFRYSNFSAKSYANNLELCGRPLSHCKNEDLFVPEEDLFVPGFVVGLSVSSTLSMLLMLFGLPRLSMNNIRSYVFIIKNLKGMKYHLILPRSQISHGEENINEESEIDAMEKYICRLNLEEIKTATNDFDNKKEDCATQI
ncbi:hypothetical protein SSX86_003373 [Deinandra increscens subsp. villosa]|uniref:Leucine-rich repeat-containing N-terminal plant-type domain-containing protein n=1 Tax=Deinandra increscens subsp. villosa TaxID=3103831 RepID=A0AAP0DPW5_9ASTR